MKRIILVETLRYDYNSATVMNTSIHLGLIIIMEELLLVLRVTVVMEELLLVLRVTMVMEELLLVLRVTMVME